MKAMVVATLAALAAGLALGGPVVLVAAADQCVAQCRSAHNQCRISTKGSPSCDSQLQSCMDRCRSAR